MMIDRAALPGLGVSHAFTTRSGDRVGVVTLHNGQRIVTLYRLDDPQAVDRAATLEPTEAGQLADLLRPAMTVSRAGPDVARLNVLAGSPADGGPVSAIEAGGARVVAVIRDGRLATPDALRVGDTVVAVGDPDGIAALAGRLEPAP